MLRCCEQRLKMRKWELLRYTPTQLWAALAQDDPNDPHKGGTVIESEEQLRALLLGE